jgi:hypothetical protein
MIFYNSCRTSRANFARMNTNIAFIDKLTFPSAGRAEFISLVKETQRFLRGLPGCLSQATYERTDADGNSVFITATTWLDQAAIEKAQQALADEYQRIGFDRAAFAKKLAIKREGDIYQVLGD